MVFSRLLYFYAYFSFVDTEYRLTKLENRFFAYESVDDKKREGFSLVRVDVERCLFAKDDRTSK